MTHFKDLPPDDQAELRDDLLRVHRELGDLVISTFEKLTRLALGTNTAGMIIVAGLAGAIHKSDEDLQGLVAAAAFYALGILCAGGTALAIYRRFSKMSAETSIDMHRVFANQVNVEESEQRLVTRTRRAGFARAMNFLVGASLVLFVVGTFASLITVWML